MLPKLLEMSKINHIICEPVTCNLQTKTSLYQDQEKILRQEDGSWTCVFYEFQ